MNLNEQKLIGLTLQQLNLNRNSAMFVVGKGMEALANQGNGAVSDKIPKELVIKCIEELKSSDYGANPECVGLIIRLQMLFNL